MTTGDSAVASAFDSTHTLIPGEVQVALVPKNDGNGLLPAGATRRHGELRFAEFNSAFAWRAWADGLVPGRAYRVELIVDGAPYSVASIRADSIGHLSATGRLTSFRNLTCVGAEAPAPKPLTGRHEIRVGVKDDGANESGTSGGGSITGVGGGTLPCSGNGDGKYDYALMELNTMVFNGS